MQLLVTGASGFIGQNLVAELKNRGYQSIFRVDNDTADSLLTKYAKECDFVFHLAGVNRPRDKSEFIKGNYGFTFELLSRLRKYDKRVPVLFSSSIQAELDNPYGRSKKAAEELLLSYSRETGTKVYIYRLPNVFGKWCRPNYNSVVATFCYNIARDLDIEICDPHVELTLCYIDDVVSEFINAMEDNPTVLDGYYTVPVKYKVELEKLAQVIRQFKQNRGNLEIPNVGDGFIKKLYSTYLSYLPRDSFSYDLDMNIDNRGSFTEFIRTVDRGQVSVNVIKPGVTKGNHWHHTKVEKLLVVSGDGLVRLRALNSNEVIEYRVSGDRLQVLDVPVGYTHSVVNVGVTDLVMVIWANECFDPGNPDTYPEEV